MQNPYIHGSSGSPFTETLHKNFITLTRTDVYMNYSISQ